MGFVRKPTGLCRAGRDYACLTQTLLPKAFHRFSRLAMVTLSRCCDSILGFHARTAENSAISRSGIQSACRLA